MKPKKTHTKEAKGGHLPTPFARNCQLNGQWLCVSLSEPELADIKAQHQAESRELFKACLEDAKALGLRNHKQVAAAVALFEKRCQKLYTLISNALDEKVRQVRSNPESRSNPQVGSTPHSPSKGQCRPELRQHKDSFSHSMLHISDVCCFPHLLFS